jgi:uncharacterized membrane protein
VAAEPGLDPAAPGTDEEFGLQKLALVSRGRAHHHRRELSPPEREHFAEEFGTALARVKRGY